jgi:hypothetical protein
MRDTRVCLIFACLWQKVAPIRSGPRIFAKLFAMDTPAEAKTAEARPALDFNVLYLDTNILIGSSWPQIGLRLENLLILASWSKVSVFIPDPVEREAEEHWLRAVSEHASGLTGAAENFRRITRQVSGAVEVKCEGEQELLERYRRLADVTKAHYGILISPFTTRPLSDLFSSSIRYVLPFVAEKNKKGKGFQDAVILSSVIEHLNSNPGFSGVLVTDDEVLSKVNISEFTPGYPKAKLKTITFEHAFPVLYDNYWDEQIKKPWEQERKNATQAVKAMHSEMRSFVESSLTDETFRSGTSLKPLKLLGVDRVDVSYVQTPIPDPTKPNRPVRIAIAVLARCRVLLEREQTFFARIMSGANYPPGEGPFESETTWVGGVEATAEVKDRTYQNIKFVSLISSQELGEKKWYRTETESAD